MAAVAVDSVPEATTFSEIEMLPRYKLHVEPPTASTISIPSDWPTYKPNFSQTEGEHEPEKDIDIAQAIQVTLTDDLIKNRFSCRFFNSSRAVEKTVVEAIIDVARFAPSGNNIQPWEKVYCMTGSTLRNVTSEILAAFLAAAPEVSDINPVDGVEVQGPVVYKSEYEYYPTPMPPVYGERREAFGKKVGMMMGIDRMDMERRREAASKNYEFYGAPVALVFTINKGLTQGSWLDVGFFLQSINIAARARGLETVTQESVCQYQAILRKHLPISENEIVAVTMGMGYPSDTARQYAMPRERRAIDDIVAFFD